MDAQELRNLQEAYMEVYSIDEGLGSAIKRVFGGGKKEAEAPKPESRGEQLRKKYNTGPERSKTSPKIKILNRAELNAIEAQNQVNRGNAPQSYADRAQAAHNRYLKAGYSKYGADLPVSGGQGGSGGSGRGSEARRRAEALNKEELEFIVNALIEEGYDLSSYTWNEMYEICLDEAVEGLDEITKELSGRVVNARIARTGRAFDREMKDRTPENMRNTVDAVDKETRAKRLAAGVRKRRNAEQNVNASYEYDTFDTILEYLIVEGYANTNESALVIMANMSEEWRQSIVEGFQPVSDNAAEAMGRREKSLRPGAYPGDVGDNWKKSIKMRDAMSKTGVKPI